MVTLQQSEKHKKHSNRVKFTLKTSENYSEGQLETKELSLCELPQKVKFTLLEWFSLFLEWFSLTLEWFSLVLRAIFTRLEWFYTFHSFKE